VTFQIVDPKEILKQHRAATMRKTTAKTAVRRQVTLMVSKNGKQKQLTLSRGLNAVIGEATTHVAVLIDPEAKRLALRPSAWGEPATRLYKTGGAQDGPSSNRALSVGAILGHLGARPTRTRRLKTTVKDGLVIVDLKPLFTKSA
jgi:hypothetical protein